jgi:hypothetical protein
VGALVHKGSVHLRWGGGGAREEWMMGVDVNLPRHTARRVCVLSPTL